MKKLKQIELKNLCETSIDIIRAEGRFMLQELNRVHQEDINFKSKNSLVSYVDETVEKNLVTKLTPLIEGVGFLTEEEVTKNKKGTYTWIIDPLDGTTNFLHQVPFFSISVALQYEDQIILGIVYEPNRDEMFYAYKDGGAFLNEKSISITNTKKLEDTLLATGFPYYDFSGMDNYLDALRYFMENTRGLRRIGSAAVDLVYTAVGRFDAFFEYSLHPWDVAAGAFIVQEAGGIVMDFSGNDNWLHGKEIVAGNPLIVKKVQEKLARRA